MNERLLDFYTGARNVLMALAAAASALVAIIGGLPPETPGPIAEFLAQVQPYAIFAAFVFASIAGNLTTRTYKRVGPTVTPLLMLPVVGLLSACGGAQSLPLVGPDTPVSAYLVCTPYGSSSFEVDDELSVTCEGTLAEPNCETNAGVAVECRFGGSITPDYLGRVSLRNVARIGIDSDGSAAELRVCWAAGPYSDCIVDEQRLRTFGEGSGEGSGGAQ